MQLMFERDFPAATESLAVVRAAVGEACRQAGGGEECAEQLVLAVNEACMNIIQHGYALAPAQQFRLCLMQDDDMLVVHLLDNGRRAAVADLRPRELDDLRPGGLGVRFIRETTDELAYLPPPAGFTNLLQLKKRIT